jgi:hypothetical protein
VLVDDDAEVAGALVELIAEAGTGRAVTGPPVWTWQAASDRLEELLRLPARRRAARSGPPS